TFPCRCKPPQITHSVVRACREAISPGARLGCRCGECRKAGRRRCRLPSKLDGEHLCRFRVVCCPLRKFQRQEGGPAIHQHLISRLIVLLVIVEPHLEQCQGRGGIVLLNQIKPAEVVDDGWIHILRGQRETVF